MRLSFLLILVVLFFSAALARAEEPSDGSAVPVRITINADKSGPSINPFIYGQFIEHLGRCIYGGIWAEMLEDRKFYYPITDEYRPYRDRKDSKYPILTASPWQVVGKAGSVPMVKEGAFVGEHSPVIARGCGIQQNDLALVAGVEYVGYVRIRELGQNSKLQVTLVDGNGDERPCGTAEFSAFKEGNEYGRHVFKFKANKTTEHGHLRLEAIGGPCSVGTVSLMPADNIRGFRADTIALLKQLNSPFYRWPGGNFVSGYDWRDGIGPRDRRPPRKNPAWTGIDSNDVGLDEFLDFCHEVKSEPMIAVNTGFGDDYSAAQEVQYTNSSKGTIGAQWRIENGHIEPYAVKYWCVGNEMWGDWQLGHMSLNQYTKKHNLVAKAMKAVDPKLILIASGDLGTKAKLGHGRGERDVNWSEGMIEECHDSMNFISEHFYCNDHPEDVAAHVAQMVDKIRGKATTERKMQSELRDRDHSIKETFPIAMDEWNYWRNPYVYGELGCEYELRDALGIAAGLHEYFRNSDIISMAAYAQTVNVIGCIKTTKTSAFLDTTALPLLLYRREFGTEPLTTTGNYSESALDIVAAKTKDGRAITIGVVNPKSKGQSINIQFDGAKPASSATVWRIAGSDPDAKNLPDKQNVSITEEKLEAFSGQIKVPAYSVNLYRVPVK